MHFPPKTSMLTSANNKFVSIHFFFNFKGESLSLWMDYLNCSVTHEKRSVRVHVVYTCYVLSDTILLLRYLSLGKR